MTDEQARLLDYHLCPACDGRKTRIDPETGLERRCGACEGTGQVDYDPDDTEIPY